MPGIGIVPVGLAQHLDGQFTPQQAVAASEDHADASVTDLLQQVIAARAGFLVGRMGKPPYFLGAGPGRLRAVGSVRLQARTAWGFAHLAADALDQGPVAGEARVVIAGARVVPGASA